MTLSDLDENLVYSYADYLKWQIEERVELIKGKIFQMSAPSRVHQKLFGYIFYEIYYYLKDKKCEVYAAPFDVRLPRMSKEDKDIVTVVQPDICVICNPEILDAKGCLGAPDIVVEILSPGNNSLELKNKYELYEESGVKEYWIVSPGDATFVVNILENGKYRPSKLMAKGEVFNSTILTGFSLDLRDMFDKME